MSDKQTTINKDREAIIRLGGPTAVADILGYDKACGGVQRVQNWMTRGIPPQVKIDHPDLFLRDALGLKEKNHRTTDKKTS